MNFPFYLILYYYYHFFFTFFIIVQFSEKKVDLYDQYQYVYILTMDSDMLGPDPFAYKTEINNKKNYFKK